MLKRVITGGHKTISSLTTFLSLMYRVFFVTDIVFVTLCLSQIKVLEAHVLKYVINRLSYENVCPLGGGNPVLYFLHS